MKISDIFKLKHVCDEMEHCGDYGYCWLDLKNKKLVVVLGDADETNTSKIEAVCKDLDIEFDILCEESPEDSEYILLSRGTEVWEDEDDWDDDLCEFQTVISESEMIPISVEDYTVLLINARKEEKLEKRKNGIY